jgi:molybdate transport system substrate-binding protein
VTISALPSIRAFATGLALLPGAAAAEQVTVFAAASLTNAMAEIEDRFEAATGHDLVVSLAGSSALARQIQQGAPADVFVSANAAWMDALEADGLIEPGTRSDLLGNRLVLIAHGTEAPPVILDGETDFPALLAGGRLAMALVEAVPAGIYGKAALESLGQWAAVAPQVAQTDNVRAALALVSAGEAPYGIVYASDAVADAGVTVVGTFPADSHPPIVYPVAAITDQLDPATATFLTFLHDPLARAAFERQGFEVLE